MSVELFLTPPTDLPHNKINQSATKACRAEAESACPRGVSLVLEGKGAFPCGSKREREKERQAVFKRTHSEP